MAILLMIYFSPSPRMGRNIGKMTVTARRRVPYGTATVHHIPFHTGWRNEV
ncbi:MAG: hypothetical protein LBV41_02595 [Cytophagaceae bacterium]|nr:hypothetical protein [Cytophagaceae bacterium]